MANIEAANYCPISPISNLSKILERVILNRLLNHLQKHNLLNPLGYFRPPRYLPACHTEIFFLEFNQIFNLAL